jgi:membrane-bound lytic murein transglycosylase MltF
MFRPVIALLLAFQVIACTSSNEPLPAAKKPFDVSGIPPRIRVLVAPSRTHYRVDNGVARGASVEAADGFESWLNAQGPAKFEVVLIETPQDRLIADLLAGRGDVAANLLLTFERDDQVAFAKPIKTAIKEIVVTAPGQPPLVSLEDVGGRAIHVRKASDHYSSLVRLNDQLAKINRPPAKIVTASAATDEDLLEMASAGKIPATIVDDYVFDAWHAQFPNLSANRDVAVSQDGSLAWVTRKAAPRLLAAMNEFFSSQKPTFQ